MATNIQVSSRFTSASPLSMCSFINLRTAPVVFAKELSPSFHIHLLLRHNNFDIEWQVSHVFISRARSHLFLGWCCVVLCVLEHGSIVLQQGQRTERDTKKHNQNKKASWEMGEGVWVGDVEEVLDVVRWFGQLCCIVTCEWMKIIFLRLCLSVFQIKIFSVNRRSVIHQIGVYVHTMVEPPLPISNREVKHHLAELVLR